MQRYAHMRRSNVERAFQIHFDDCCYVCQPKLKLNGERLKEPTGGKTGCLLSGIDDERARCATMRLPWIKKDQ